MRNIEEIAAEEESRIHGIAVERLRNFLVIAAIGSGIWGWRLFAQGQMGKGSLGILGSLFLFGVAWGALRVLYQPVASFMMALLAGGGAFVLYSITRLPSFFWGQDPAFWLSVHTGAVVKPLWSP